MEFLAAMWGWAGAGGWHRDWRGWIILDTLPIITFFIHSSERNSKEQEFKKKISSCTSKHKPWYNSLLVARRVADLQAAVHVSNYVSTASTHSPTHLKMQAKHNTREHTLVFQRLTYGMIHKERDLRARLSKPIPAFLSSLSSAAIGHPPLWLSLSPSKHVTINHLLFSLYFCCFCFFFPPASMGTVGKPCTTGFLVFPLQPNMQLLGISIGHKHSYEVTVTMMDWRDDKHTRSPLDDVIKLFIGSSLCGVTFWCHCSQWIQSLLSWKRETQ